MSLNGLDNAEVAEAYRTSLGEAGGWFLLKYTSRDSVEILKRGTGGVSEARTTIDEYEDPSPLYGFLLYRRRKVLLKYVPESTSRLLKARMHVHFEHIQERFSPWDTVFELGTADELTDSALGSACALHTALSPTRNKKLSGITEYTETDEGDGTETQARDRDEKIEEKKEEQVHESDKDENDDDAKEIEKGKSKSSHKRYRSMVDQAIEEARPSTSSSIKTNKDQEGASTSLSRSATNASNYSQATLDAATSYAASIHSTKTYDYHAADRRNSTQTLRPATSDLYSGMYSYKPKVKLGPRPSLDANKRPHTTSSGSSRQVATLPAGMRASRKTPQTPQTSQAHRPQSRESTKSAFASTIGPAPPIPHAPRTPSIITRPTSSHSTKTTLSTSGISPTTPRITPEKQRLMKAVELRKRQQQAAREKAKKAEASVESTSTTGEASNPNQEPHSPKQIPEPEIVAPRKEVVVDTAPEKPAPATSTDQNVPETADSEDIKVDSAVEIVVTEKADNDTDDTRSITLESSPTSMKEPSTPSSTRPSSLSDSEEQKVIPTPTRAVDAREDVRGSDTTIQVKLDDALAQEKPSSDDADDTESIDEKDDSTPTQETIHSGTPDIKIEVAEPSVEEDQPKLDTKPSRETVEPIPSRPQTMINISSDGPNTKEELPVDEIKLPDRSLDDEKDDVEIDTRTSNKEGPLKAGPGLDQPLEQKPSNLREKRQASIEPIHTEADNHSDADYLSDDSFMEELQSAKVQEAKPVSVSKSPMSPFFNRPASARSFSNPSGLSPAPPSPLEGARSVSATYVGTVKSPGDQVVVPKKINVSSGISQRIKALTEKSSKRDSIASQPSNLTPDGNSIVNMRKSSLRTPPSRSPSSGSRVGPVTSKRNSLSSRQSSPELIRHSSNLSQSAPEVPPIYNVQNHDGHSESVSVTARIIRDPRDQAPSGNVTPETPLELHQSPLTINHSRGTRSSVSLSNTMVPPQPIRSHSDTKAPTVASSNGTRDSSAPNSRSSIDSARRSIRRPSLPSRNRSSTSLHTDDGSLNSPVEEGSSKKSNRASRLLKRMSSSLSNASRKSLSQLSSPTNEDVSTPVRELATVPEPPAGTQLGDLNVQFPDTLLWKWRWVEIDSQGNMVLQAPKSERTPQKGQAYTRKYHLNEFSLPYAPDQDRQEMPNSIILDFLDGRTLQCACEDAMDQTRVLNLLQECHRAWTSYQH